MSGESPRNAAMLDGAAVRRALRDPALVSDDLRLLLCVAVGVATTAEDCARAAGLDRAAADRAWHRLAAQGYLPTTLLAVDRGRRRPARRGGQASLHGDLLRRGRAEAATAVPRHPVVDDFNSDRRAVPLGTAMASLLGVDTAGPNPQEAAGADRFRLWLRTILPPEDADILLSAGNDGDDACRQLARRYDRAEDDAALDLLLEETEAAVARVRTTDD